MENLKNKQKKYLKIIWVIFLSPIAILFLLIFMISMGWLGFMPTFEDLENPKLNLATEIYSEDGIILGTLAIENRNNIEYKDLSPYLVQALIAREDHRYKKHSGIDGIGLLRVIGKTILLGKRGEGGGSTITQQLAKNLFPRDTTHYKFGIYRKLVLSLAKLKEWVIAVKLERNYSKDEIISMYFNTVSFGYEAFGIKAASRTFFSKSPDSLKIEEAAVLVGMLKADTKYNPKRNPERSKFRRDGVLTKMFEHGYISKSQLDSLIEVPIQLKYQPQGQDWGLATYFREFLRNTMTRTFPQRKEYVSYKKFQEDSTRWIEDPLFGWCNKNFKPDNTPYNIYKDGLKIYTTINSKMQEYAEAAVVEHLSKTIQPKFFKENAGNRKAPFATDLAEDIVKQRMMVAMVQSERYRNLYNSGATRDEILKNFKVRTEMKLFSWNGEIDTIMTPWDSIKYAKSFFRASFMVMDPKSGFVKVYVGGPNFKYFKYDGVTLQKRQVGSTIKPFLYTLAMQEGFSPCYLAPNVPVTFDLGNDSTYTPRNSGTSRYDGKMVTLRWGLAQSSNYISGWLVKQFNPQSIADMIKKMGVKSEVLAVPSVYLGTSEMSLYELVGAYTAFANKGVCSQPIFVTRIEDKNGTVISTFQSQKIEAINEKTAYLMSQMLKFVVSSGTGLRLKSYNLKDITKMGAKTGTTQAHADGWFVCISPDLVGGVWVGCDELNIHFQKIQDGQGSAMALPIFGLFMQKVDSNKNIIINQSDFEMPAGFNIDLDCPMSEVEKEANEDNSIELF